MSKIKNSGKKRYAASTDNFAIHMSCIVFDARSLYFYFSCF